MLSFLCISSTWYNNLQAVADADEELRNFALSSITAASSILSSFLGAHGKTKEELDQFLNVEKFGEQDICVAFAKLWQSLPDKNNNIRNGKEVPFEPRLLSNHRLFHSSGDRLLSSYISAIKSLKCDAVQVDFLATAQAFRKMAQWIEDVGNKLSPAETAELKGYKTIECKSVMNYADHYTNA